MHIEPVDIPFNLQTIRRACVLLLWAQRGDALRPARPYFTRADRVRAPRNAVEREWSEKFVPQPNSTNQRALSGEIIISRRPDPVRTQPQRLTIKMTINTHHFSMALCSPHPSWPSSNTSDQIVFGTDFYQLPVHQSVGKRIHSTVQFYWLTEAEKSKCQNG